MLSTIFSLSKKPIELHERSSIACIFTRLLYVVCLHAQIDFHLMCVFFSRSSLNAVLSGKQYACSAITTCACITVVHFARMCNRLANKNAIKNRMKLHYNRIYLFSVSCVYTLSLPNTNTLFSFTDLRFVFFIFHTAFFSLRVISAFLFGSSIC